MKIIQLTYLMIVVAFWGCHSDQPADKPTICSIPATLSADEAHQKGLDFFKLAADTTYQIRQQLADSAICYFKYELQLWQQQLGQHHWRVHKAQLNLGVIYQHDFYDLVTAQQYYESALFNSKTDTTGMNPIAPFLEAEILYNIGLATERLGDYDLSKAHALRADSIFMALKVLNESDDSNDFQNYLNNLSNLGDIHAAMKDPRALEYFNRVLHSKQNIPADIRLQVILNRGIAYRLMQQLKVAETDLLQAQKNCTEREDSANVRIELAKLYLDKKEFPIAEDYAFQSLKLRSDYPKGHIIFAEIYTVLGRIYLKTNQLEKAKKAFHDALGDVNSKSYRSNWQIEALSQLADLQPIQEASQTYETLSELLYQRKSFFKTDAAKINITQQARKIYQKSIHLNNQLFEDTKDKKYLNQILTDMERSKSVLLSEMIQDTRIKSYYDVPNEVREQERNLKLVIAQAERKLNQDTSTFQTNITDLSTKYSEWQGFVQQLKQKYPKYYALKHAEPQLLEIKTVQNQLPNNALLLNYYLTDSTLHILAINQSTSKSYERTLTKQFDTVYNQYQRLLAQKDWDSNQNLLFSQASYQLYQYLLEKPLQDFKTNSLIFKIKDLIIIPDDKLASLSFAALFTKASLLSNKHEEPYLINDYSVNMAYTLNDFGMGISDFGIKGSNPKFVYSGFSHDFNIAYQGNVSSKQLTKLLESKAHIEQINNFFKSKGQTFINPAMTLAEFKTVVPQSRIIELISHAGFDEQDTRKAAIAFPKAQQMDLLDLKDIYNLNCTANELLTLIACETGRGLPMKGETVISMAYAFAYSGSRRRVSALWSIPHKESMDLMSTFFKNVLEKQTPARALQNAQKAFLESDKKPATAQRPNLWAGLVLSGNIAPIAE
jgi:CHAT domain-containing protein